MIWQIRPSGRQLYVSNVAVDHILTRRSGGSAISPDERLIALSNLADGFEFYTLSDQQRIYTINISESVPTSILFDQNGSIMFGGSSRAAYVASGTPPAIKQTLKYEGKLSLCVES
jgi:hypothetical protein